MQNIYEGLDFAVSCLQTLQTLWEDKLTGAEKDCK